VILSVLAGCARKAAPSPQSGDKSEVLLRHVLRRVSDLTDELGKRESEIVENGNRCLQEQIAILEGRSIRHAKRDPSAGIATLSQRLAESNHRLVQNLLDNEDWIEEQNRKHPGSPQADIKDLLRHMCGDCTRERTIRDAQLKEESEKYDTPRPGSGK